MPELGEYTHAEVVEWIRLKLSGPEIEAKQFLELHPFHHPEFKSGFCQGQRVPSVPVIDIFDGKRVDLLKDVIGCQGTCVLNFGSYT